MTPMNVSSKPKKNSILCMLGFHKWEKAGGVSYFSSNVKEKKYRCKRCGKMKTIYETKK